MNDLQLFLGGSFNPIHLGHMRLAVECAAVSNAGLSLVPTALPALKEPITISGHHRKSLLELALQELNAIYPKENPRFQLEWCEWERAGPSYTLHTLQVLKNKYPLKSLVWIIGMDNLNVLTSWYKWRELTEWANILVINRPGWSRPITGEIADWVIEHECDLNQLPSAGKVAFLETTPLDISSTRIKKVLANKMVPDFLVSAAVCQYMHKHQLYL